ncbi:MAG TPA: DEAD/DEAH box helicase, partial [Chloroflexota bacterium]|nr:DEAD/DEAH box helicase [Chloroflexota bacterium]
LDIPQAVVLAPTRELAVQVAEQLGRLGHNRGLRVVSIYGGQPYEHQLRALKRGVHTIVATPGRLLDHLRRGTADLSAVKLVVLDEADQMLDMGFLDDVETILGHVPAEHNTALFSATMPKPILDLVGRYLKKPEMLHLSEARALTVPSVDQIFYEVPYPRKMDALCRVLDARQPSRAIVFCATKRMVDEAVERLQAIGYSAEALHGDVSQPGREKVLRGFREGRTEILVATDVAARGLDVPEVSLVVNFDIPPDPEYYVHRIGRTGRLGRGGEAITFVNPRELRELRLIERATGARIRPAEVPSLADIEARDLQVLEEQLLDAIGKDGWARYRAVIQDLMGDHDPIDLAAAALTLVATSGKRRLKAQPREREITRPPRERTMTSPPERHQTAVTRPEPRAIAPVRPNVRRDADFETRNDDEADVAPRSPGPRPKSFGKPKSSRSGKPRPGPFGKSRPKGRRAKP